jgi:hypothetical protein
MSRKTHLTNTQPIANQIKKEKSTVQSTQQGASHVRCWRTEKERTHNVDTR